MAPLPAPADPTFPKGSSGAAALLQPVGQAETVKKRPLTKTEQAILNAIAELVRGASKKLARLIGLKPGYTRTVAGKLVRDGFLVNTSTEGYSLRT